MIENIIIHFCLQVFFAIVLIVALGWVLGWLSRYYYRAFGTRAAYKLEILTGAVGTPIHELSHALMCIIFGHKIIEIKLYQPDDESGTLGYVKHSYDKRKFYCVLGNFFIGIAPLIFGSVALLLLMYLLIPATLDGVLAVLHDAIFSGYDIQSILLSVPNILGWLFAPDAVVLMTWWIFLLVGSSIALHMRVSKADIASSKSGIAFVLIGFAAIDIVLGVIYPQLMRTFTAACFSFGLIIASFLVLAILLSVIVLAVGVIIRQLAQLARRK